jgi:hypothetical protein
MLGNYPIQAAAENWVHVALIGKVKAALLAIHAGGGPPLWEEGMAEALCGVTLERPYLEFCAQVTTLRVAVRNKLLRAIDDQNDIPAVFDGASPCTSLTDLPKRARIPLVALFSAAFKALSRLKVRDRQYSLIYNALPGKMCPFCGLELFDHPSLPREHLDHFLPLSKYPFAGANLRNLAPMGSKCNSVYKGANDVIRNAEGVRRRCFDPYGATFVSISLDRSVPFAGTSEGEFDLPRWTIDFDTADQGAAETWDEVLRIRERYRASVLDPFFRGWMEDFAYWCVEAGLELEDPAASIEAMKGFLRSATPSTGGFANFLRRPMFEMLIKHCQGGPLVERLAQWLRSYVVAQGSIVAESYAAV